MEQLDEQVKPQFRQVFKAQRDELWQRMSRAHDKLFLLERMHDSDFRALIDGEYGSFWDVATHSLSESLILLLHGLVVDAGQDVLSLVTFKTRLMTKWVADSHRDSLKARLHASKFEKATAALGKSVRELRNHHVAHCLWLDDATEPHGPLPRIAIEDLQELFRAAEMAWSELNRPVVRHVGNSDYTNPAPGECADIDRVKRVLAASTSFVRKPESAWWDIERAVMDENELDWLREWRAKLGLDPI